MVSSYSSAFSHLLAQGLAGLDGLLIGFGAGGSDDLVGFFRGAGFGFFDDALCPTLGIGQAGRRFIAGFGQLFFHALVGGAEVGLGLVGSGETFGNFLGTFVQGRGDWRPDEFHREPDQNQEDNDLDYEGSGNAHVESFM
jgi:hypothetical protein